MGKQGKATLVAAMGRHEGDFLKLENKWAKVFITREVRDIEVAPRMGNVPAVAQERLVFVVSGHLAGVRAAEQVFHTGPAAMRYAMFCLAEYEKGAIRPC